MTWNDYRFKNLSKAILSLSLCSLLSINLYAQQPELNQTFGTNGIATLQKSSNVNIAKTLSDKSLLTASYNMREGTLDRYDLIVSKLKPDGNLDLDFGSQGYTTTEIMYSGYPLDIEVLEDNSFIVLGSAYAGPTPNGPGLYYGFATRYNAQGIIESSFGANGISYAQFSGSHYTNAIALEDGSFLLAGNIGNYAALTKVTANGQLDNSYGSMGIKYINANGFNMLMWEAQKLANGNLLIVGFEMNNAEQYTSVACRVDIDGNLDAGFGNGGVVKFDANENVLSPEEYFCKAIVMNDGSYLFLGQKGVAYLIKTDASGAIIPTFGTNGIQDLAFGYKDVKVDNTNTIWLAGSTFIEDYNMGYTLAKLNADGRYNSEWGNNGHFNIDISTGNDLGEGLLLQDTETILLYGSHRKTSGSKGCIISIKKNETVAVKDINIDPKYKIYPNPFNDALYFEGDINTIENFSLYEVTGKLLWQQDHLSKAQPVLSSLSRGTYILNCLFKNGSQQSHTLVKP
jgi:uncharacterized delta-60 repeat protein